MPIGGLDPVLGNIEILRSGTHLTGIKRDRESQVLYHPGKIIRGINDNLIYSSFFCITRGFSGLLLQPLSVLSASGKIDDFNFRTQGELLRSVVIRIMGNQSNDIRVKTTFVQ